MFTEPTRCMPLDDSLTVVELWFNAAKDTENGPNGCFLVRGGVAWPMQPDQQSGRQEGYAVILGYNLRTERAYVFDETAFVAVRHIVEPTSRAILNPGIAPWFSRVWNRYLCDTYYQNQAEALCQWWEANIRRAPEIQPSPRLVSIEPWADVRVAEGILWDWIERRALRWFNDGGIQGAVRAYPKGGATFLPTKLHALMAGLIGLSGMIDAAKQIAADTGEAAKPFLGNDLLREYPREWHDPEEAGR